MNHAHTAVAGLKPSRRQHVGCSWVKLRQAMTTSLPRPQPWRRVPACTQRVAMGMACGCYMAIIAVIPLVVTGMPLHARLLHAQVAPSSCTMSTVPAVTNLAQWHRISLVARPPALLPIVAAAAGARALGR